ncbi:MAG: hypothetical protein IJN67_07385 [Oscillospiraceae bacterium]|nr:hypothetical protein [Oscillospiraceae bacterium]
MKNILKVLTALATIAGAVYIIATYGEQIVAWAKKLWNAMPKCPSCEEAEIVEEFEAETSEEAPAEEPAAEEIPVVEEEPAPEVVVAEHEPVAEEADFAE